MSARGAAVSADGDPGPPGVLDRWAGALLRRGAQSKGVVRSPVDAVRGAVALLVAAVSWWASTGYGGAGWSLSGVWIAALLGTTLLLTLTGTGVALLVLAIAQRRWLLGLAAALGAVAAVLVVVGGASGDITTATVGWTVGIAAATAQWPAGLGALHRALGLGELTSAVVLLLYTTISLPALLATAAAGYAAGCAWRLVAGRDIATVTPAEAVALAQQVGVRVTDLERARRARSGTAERFRGRTDSGMVEVWVYQRGTVDTQVMSGLLRFLWYRNSRMPVALTRLQNLEHHLAVSLRAAEAGASSSTIVAAGLAGTAEDVVVVSTVDAGRPLSELDRDEVDDRLLDALWQVLDRLGRARVAHGAITAETVATDGSGWTVRDLPGGSVVATARDVAADRAACLVVTAAVVGTERAVAACCRGLDDQQLAEVLSMVQAAALPAGARPVRTSPLLKDLRQALSGALGIESAELAEVRRLKASSVLMAAGTLLGLWLLIGEFAGFDDLWQTILSASWGWLAVAFVVGVVPNVTQAIATSGAVAATMRIAPLVMLRLADGFFGLVGGTVATTAAAVRYFQKEGLGASIAVSSGVLYSLAGFAVQVVISLVAALFARGSFSLANLQASSGGAAGDSGGHGDWLWLLLGAAVLVGVVAGLLALRPRFRSQVLDKAKPQYEIVRDNLRDIASQPGKLRRLFGANLASQLLFAWCLGLCLHAYGGSTSIWVLILVNTAASLFGGLAPIPGGMGVMEGAIITGLMAAGIPEAQAVPTTFAYRLITAYLPPVWGYPAIFWLRRHEYL
ncbi:MAG: lysylphosphatidylglycerol synthase transmembrane domain-containing protein [Dermatophilaceae bacterium]